MVKKPLFEEDDETTDNGSELTNEEINDEFAKHIQVDNEEGSEFQNFGKFAVNDDWVEKFNCEIRLPHESYEQKMLRENLYDIFVNSNFYEKYAKIKKIPKQDMLRIFLYFYDNIKEKQRFTSVEKFLEIADFMNMNYEMMYKKLPMLYKQHLIAELDKKYKIFSKRKVHKLF